MNPSRFLAHAASRTAWRWATTSSARQSREISYDTRGGLFRRTNSPSRMLDTMIRPLSKYG